jgi:hypothetical protein
MILQTICHQPGWLVELDKSKSAMATTSSEVRLSREMRLLDITMIGVGAMIGAGLTGPGLLLVFLLNGFVTLFAAAAYAELGTSFHDVSGGYLWVKTGLKDPQGFMSGWMSWFAHAGYLKRARFILEKALGYANHLVLYAEELGMRGEQLCNFPQAFTHLALISAACNLDWRLSAVNET